MRNDSQNICRKTKLFLVWCALTGIHADTEAFIIRHIVEVAKTTHDNAIGVEGTSTAIAKLQTMKFAIPKPHLLGGVIATLANMTIIDTKGGINKYPLHKQMLFTFLDVV